MKLKKLRDKPRHPIWLVLEGDTEIQCQLSHFRMMATGYFLRMESDEPITLTFLHQEIMDLGLYQLNQWLLENRKISLKDYLIAKVAHHKSALSVLEALVPEN